MEKEFLYTHSWKENLKLDTLPKPCKYAPPPPQSNDQLPFQGEGHNSQQDLAHIECDYLDQVQL